MTTTHTEVDGHPAEIKHEPEMIKPTIVNLVHDLRREVNERNKRAVASARARERVKESDERIKGLVDEICRLDEEGAAQTLLGIVDEESVDDFEDEDEGDDDGEEDD